MRNAWKPWLVLAGLAFPSLPASAGMPYPQTVKCPVGGKSFEHVTTASYSTWGSRPDGKPYGSWRFPMKLPKCPDNGLIVFDEFTPDEVKRLELLVGGAEYRAIRDRETDYFLAAWLMERLGRPPIDVAWMIVQASWEADGRPDLKARYQALYVERIRALPKSRDGIDWLIMQGRAVNGLRELKRFNEAKALLATLDRAPLDVSIPKRKTGRTKSEQRGEVGNEEEIEEAENKRAFLRYFKQLGDALDARDSSAEPLRMIPAQEAAAICQRSAGRLSRTDKAYCESRPIRKEMS
jgi:hypothetical protein